MNTLSWFLYLADVVSWIGWIFAFFGVIFVIVGTVGWGGWSIAKGAQMANSIDNNDKSAKEWEPFIFLWDQMKKFFLRGFLLILASAFMPEKKTMYAMAASEFGEMVVKNQKVQEVASDSMKALNSWIKQQIEPKEGKSK